MAILHTAHVLAVPDCDATATFFIEKLGFQTWWNVPTMWHAVERENCRIMLGSCPDAIPPGDLGDHSYFAYFNVDDVDAMHAELKSRGLDLKEAESQPWGMREFGLRTPDGHRITFGQAIG